MGKLIVTEFVTLDGVAQAPGGPDEDRAGGFAHGGWQAPVADEESGEVIFEQARSMDALLLGLVVIGAGLRLWQSLPARGFGSTKSCWPATFCTGPPGIC